MLNKLFLKTKEDTQANDAEELVSQKTPVIGVLGAKGGVGVTTIAVNLAARLASQQISTTIIDANFQQPDVCQMLGQVPAHSLLELLSRADNLDKQLFEACCVNVSNLDSHLSLLSPPLSGEAAFKTNLSDLANCITSIRSYRDFWIIDMPRHIDKHLVTLADTCDKILLVFEATVSGVAATQRWLNIFRELGYNQELITCVLNRAGSKYSGVEQQLSTYFDQQQVFCIPNVSALTWKCATNGKTIVLSYPNHPYTHAMLELAKHVLTISR